MWFGYLSNIKALALSILYDPLFTVGLTLWKNGDVKPSFECIAVCILTE